MRILLLLTLILLAGAVQAQDFDPGTTYVLTKNDGTRYVGTISSSDAREVVIRTKTLGEIVIPKHEIRSIVPYRAETDSVRGDLFATRYFLTTNALPMERGDSYVQWTLIGPDMQFAAGDNLSVGVITTWWLSPMAVSLKYSGSSGAGSGARFAVGALAGSTLWQGEFYFALPYGAVTLGGTSGNLNLAAGYGVSSIDGRSRSQALFSVGGMKKISRSGSLVFDSVLVPYEGRLNALIVPGIRIQNRVDAAFQIGFGGILARGTSDPVPTISWFRKF